MRGNVPASVPSLTHASSPYDSERASNKMRVPLPADTPEPTVIALVEQLNHDPAVNGILVQLPLPPQIRSEAIQMLKEGIEAQYANPGANRAEPRGRSARRKAAYVDAIADRSGLHDRMAQITLIESSAGEVPVDRGVLAR